MTIKRFLEKLFILIALTLGTTAALAASNVIEYSYDNAGNLTRIKRQGTATPGLAISSFAPSSGAPGTAVTLYGTGFDATPANNAVKFNGVAAIVSTATTSSLAVTVPTTATTGAISITVGSNSATSATPFTVTPPGAPSISGFTPDRGAAGTSVTVTGANFNPIAGTTTVKLNTTTVTATVTGAAQLSFPVPANTGSGKISVTTSAGTGLSATDFIVPPPYTTAAEIGQALRFIADAPAQAVSDAGPNLRVLIAFEGTQDSYLTFQFSDWASSPAAAAVTYALYKPDNTQLVSGGTVSAASPTIHLPKLPVTGTYVLLLSPGLSSFSSSVKLENNLLLPLDGASTTLTTRSVNQALRVLVNVAAGQSQGLGVAGITLAPASTSNVVVNANQPNGASIASANCYTNTASGQCAINFYKLALAGVYPVTITPPTGSRITNAVATLSTDIALGDLAYDVVTPLNLARQGQNAQFTFQGTAGSTVGIEVAGYIAAPVVQGGTLTLYKPDGAYYLNGSIATLSQGAFINIPNLPVSGSYSGFIDPYYGVTATGQVKIKSGATLALDGASQSVAMTTSGETPYFKFAGSAGQYLSVALTGLGYHAADTNYTTLNINTPAGVTLASANCYSANYGGGCRASLPVLPATGIYTVTLTPPSGIKITTGNLWLSSALTGSLTLGTPYSLALTRAGQGARLTFNATAGSGVGVELANVVSAPVNQYYSYLIYKPDGAYLAGGNVAPSSFGGYVNLSNLPVTGAYTLFISPAFAQTGSMQVTVDSGSNLAIDGATQSFATTVAGETVRMTFTATAGQSLGLGLMLTYTDASTSPTYLYVYKPDGSTLNYTACFATSLGGGCKFNLSALPVSGTYSIVLVQPVGIRISGSATLSTDLAATLTLGTALNVNLARAGQNARLTFSATAGASLGVELANVVTAPVNQNYSYSVLKPDGTLLTSGATSYASFGGFINLPNLPVTGTYTLFISPYVAQTGSMLVTVDSGNNLAIDGATQSFATTIAGETVRMTFSATAGQNLGLGLTLSYIDASGYGTSFTVNKPDGAFFATTTCYATSPGGGCKFNLSALPVSGTYSIVFTQPSGIRISGTATLSTDLVATLTQGAALNINLARAGQNARLAFSATAGASLGVELANVVTAPVNQNYGYSVLKPDGTVLTSGATSYASFGGFTNLPNLPVTGTYTLFISPYVAQTGSMQVTVDSGNNLVIDGATQSFATTVSGETVRMTYTATAGQNLGLGLTLAYTDASPYPTYIYVYKPDGSYFTYFGCNSTYPGGGCDVNLVSLPVSGTYSIVFTQPSGIRFSGTATLSTPLAAGTLVVGAAAQNLSITRPGQTARYTFSGSAAQLLRLNWSATTVTSATNVAISLLKPDGTQLTAASYTAGVAGMLDIPALPVTGTYTIIFDPSFAAATSANIALVTR